MLLVVGQACCEADKTCAAEYSIDPVPNDGLLCETELDWLRGRSHVHFQSATPLKRCRRNECYYGNSEKRKFRRGEKLQSATSFFLAAEPPLLLLRRSILCTSLLYFKQFRTFSTFFARLPS